jgi:hypothetical protein
MWQRVSYEKIASEVKYVNRDTNDLEEPEGIIRCNTEIETN